MQFSSGYSLIGVAGLAEVARRVDVRAAVVGHGEEHHAVALDVAGFGERLLVGLPDAVDDGRLARIARGAVIKLAAEIDDFHGRPPVDLEGRTLRLGAASASTAARTARTTRPASAGDDRDHQEEASSWPCSTRSCRDSRARKLPVKLVASHTPIIIETARAGATLVTSDSADRREIELADGEDDEIAEQPQPARLAGAGDERRGEQDQIGGGVAEAAVGHLGDGRGLAAARGLPRATARG